METSPVATRKSGAFANVTTTVPSAGRGKRVAECHGGTPSKFRTQAWRGDMTSRSGFLQSRSSRSVGKDGWMEGRECDADDSENEGGKELLVSLYTSQPLQGQSQSFGCM